MFLCFDGEAMRKILNADGKLMSKGNFRLRLGITDWATDVGCLIVKVRDMVEIAYSKC